MKPLRQTASHKKPAGKPPSFKNNKPAHLNLRARVIVLLQQVYDGQSLNQILPQAIEQTPVKDKGLFNELVMGTLRHWFALDAQIQPMLVKPLKDRRVHMALLLGLYQLLQTRIPAHAAISETVDAIKQLKLDQASGLVNALLRRATREMDSMQHSFEQQHGLPNWLYKQLKKDWPAQADQIAQTLRQSAPLTLRVNSRQCSRDEYVQQLQQQNIAARACALSPDGIVLEQAVAIPELPGFAQGWFSVQDEHAQLCAAFLGNLDNKIVLDACAAPGGKTAHLLEKNDPALLIALDQDEKRLTRVYDNLQRLQLLSDKVEIVAADAASWTYTQSFDHILLDAPCTATGVIRRHPDIRLLRQPSDVAQTVQLQAELLDHLWQQLKPGGNLLYVTCSLLRQENEQQIQAFLQRTTDAKVMPLAMSGSGSVAVGIQLLPQPGGGDGFYFAKLEKS
ncbi:16S rRNA (cytosine(967)-C(5))-methyltransferase RsmB [Alkanindiges sp. WGS2144]|uniref:16S rRNA (cytosine(967)-C(5))-methyltransferase RsmB n=1 Tax=Alkanindiges sp. WGS2144 TaxID=3366808 RepID=UPI003753CD11